MSDREEFEKWYAEAFDPEMAAEGSKDHTADDKEQHWETWQAARAQQAGSGEAVHQFQPPSMDEGWIDCNERDLRIYQQDGHYPTRTLYTHPSQRVRVAHGYFESRPGRSVRS